MSEVVGLNTALDLDLDHHAMEVEQMTACVLVK
jgi:hypothetical protein